MLYLKNALLTAILCAILFPALQAQLSLDDINHQVKSGDYKVAVLNYQKLLEADPNNVEAMGRLADVYFKAQDFQAAIDLYDRISKQDLMKPEFILNYAHTLKSMGLYNQAKNYYLQYATVNDELGSHFIESCNLAEQILQQPDQYNITISDASSSDSDFGISFYRNNMIYSSFRGDIKRSSYSQLSGNELFVHFPKTENELSRLSFLRADYKDHKGIGPVDYSDEKVAFTKNNFQNGFSQISGGENHLNIYLADVSSDLGDWENEIAFEHNMEGYGTAFPSFDDLSDVLYFSSNRPGGYGGFDIYVSRLVNGTWTTPVNLGPTVNSPGNEITPHKSFDELYFSSDYHAGLGGYDVFVYNQTSEILSNVGKGVNSPMDDYYYVIGPNNSVSYVTSNRLGGKGKDDIYIVEQIVQENYALEEDMYIPKVVDLEELAASVPRSQDENLQVSHNISSEAARPKNTTMRSVSAVVGNYFSLENARRVAFDDVVVNGTDVYFIQLASLSSSSGNYSKFNHLNNLGSIYKVYKGSTVKIRLGYYYDQNDAKNKLNEVKSRGIRDAFIVHEPLNTGQLELIKNQSGLSSSTPRTDVYIDNPTPSNNAKYSAPSNISNYKIRLASYTDPLWFDIGSVKDIGEIEQWTKGEYTIFVLSGYSSLRDAQGALIKAKNRGFQEAHIVEDINGYLQKINQN